MSQGVKGTITHGYSAYGRGCRCEICRNGNKNYRIEYAKRHPRDPVKNLEAVIRNQNKRREAVRRAKEKSCTDCGVQYPYYVMQFDHIKDKSFAISQNSARTPISKMADEIAKCEVVCANCHAARTFKRIVEKQVA